MREKSGVIRMKENIVHPRRLIRGFQTKEYNTSLERFAKCQTAKPPRRRSLRSWIVRSEEGQRPDNETSEQIGWRRTASYEANSLIDIELTNSNAITSGGRRARRIDATNKSQSRSRRSRCGILRPLFSPPLTRRLTSRTELGSESKPRSRFQFQFPSQSRSASASGLRGGLAPDLGTEPEVEEISWPRVQHNARLSRSEWPASDVLRRYDAARPCRLHLNGSILAITGLS
ncbi:hypothetical protein EVAR_59479_1 [Eumeta japonica]|uniref:Uncharacterized protein n=1 Tax=Eumeta variegata TaxID=151549 RepID=A0A4C1YW07_EUMVA|nr:hypothetical protein EVAR_59479_1 [Eumeta japonica]